MRAGELGGAAGDHGDVFGGGEEIMTDEQAARILEYPVYKWSMDWDEREDGLSYCEAISFCI